VPILTGLGILIVALAIHIARKRTQWSRRQGGQHA
jgi:hypothetical protein